jgi:hypothetical protein
MANTIFTVIEPLITALTVLQEPLCGLKQMKENMDTGGKGKDKKPTYIFTL